VTSTKGNKGILFALILMLCGMAVRAQDDTATELSSRNPVEQFATGGSVNSNSVAVLVMDLKTGKVIGEWNADKPMTPASVMKCVTTASLLNKVGETWKYETPVYITGRIRDHILDGNIVVEASGDPSLKTRHEPGSSNIVDEIVRGLKAEKVDTVRGGIVIDESRFAGPAINPTWASGDLSRAYGTGTHGFNFEDNASGGASVKDPSAVFQTRLRAALSRNGIVLQDRDVDAKDHRKLIGTHRSAEISEIMRSCMMRSDNQYAEGMLRTYSERTGGDGSTAAGAKEEMNHWRHRKINTKDVNIVDGSGLSRSNRLTAKFLGGILRDMASNPYYASFFPLAGQEGTLKRFLAGTRLEGYVAMKTGSMNGIQSYAGYKINENYEPTHVIVVMINNMADRARAREGVRRMLESIF